MKLDPAAMQLREDEIVDGIVAGALAPDLFDPVGVSCLFPEYALSQPRGVWTGGVPLYAVLPFYRQLIVHVDPVPTAAEFRRVYGISVAEMQQLREEGRVVALLRAPYDRYPSCLSPLLCSHMPRNNRFERVFCQLAEIDETSFAEHLRASYPKSTTKIPKGLREEANSKASGTNPYDYLLGVMAQRMQKLEVVGLRHEASEAIRTQPLGDAYRILHAWNRAIAVPTMDALGGWDNLDDRHLALVSQAVDAPNHNQVVLPRDILFWFASEMDYTYPTEVESGMSFLRRVEQTDEAAENHGILTAIQSKLLAGDFEQSAELVERSTQLLGGLKREVARVQRSALNLQKWTGSPIRYAALTASVGSFAAAANALSSADLHAAMHWGTAGIVAQALHYQAGKIGQFLASLRHGSSSVPVVIWKRLRYHNQHQPHP